MEVMGEFMAPMLVLENWLWGSIRGSLRGDPLEYGCPSISPGKVGERGFSKPVIVTLIVTLISLFTSNKAEMMGENQEFSSTSK